MQELDKFKIQNYKGLILIFFRVKPFNLTEKENL